MQEFLNKDQRSFMSDSVDEPAKKPESRGFFSRCFACLTVEHYRQYFDITQEQVVHRVTKSLFPFSGEPLFENGKEDLYTPLWIFISLNICMAIFGKLAIVIDHAFDEIEYHNQIDAHKLAGSYGFLLFYFVVIPAALYFALSLFASESPAYTKVLSVYGYSFMIFIPITFGFLIPIEIVRWALLLAAG
mmetsp:Transcript_25418/g.22573  ORF Transcript_25418/g.22573 Transcript_25418/m.22573 type:complete len:189 (-) Transcript_25418:180-746(-)